MRPIDADVVFVVEHWDGKAGRLEALGGVALLELGLGVLDRPASIAVLLPDPGRPLLPALRDLALLDRGLLLIDVALFRCRRHRSHR